MIAIVSINGVAPAVQPLRDSYAVIKSDLLASGSGRTAETGRTLRYLVRKDVYKITLKFKGRSSEIAQVDQLVSQFRQRVVFVWGGQTVTADMYPGDRNITDNGITAELTVNLIEE